MAMEKTFQPKAAEARISQAWIDGGHFRAGAGATPGAETFSILIPPPNVTGSLHIGHAFNNTLQDILVRWHRMRGFDTLWQAGTDHAGIATQMVVERAMAAEGNVRRQDMSREDFVARVWAQKAKSGDRIVEQLRRLGCSCDWDRLAFTMSGAPGAPAGEGGNFHDAVIKVFCDLYEKGLIYRGKRLVNWDPHFETAISDLEVESREVAGHMWHFRYPLAGGETYDYVERDADGEILFTEERDWISIATTRPETMLGDGAVAVHPSDARYAAIVGKLCEIPVGPKESRRLIPIIEDEYPDPAFGSGAVKITGAHDFNDYAVAKRNGIPCYRLMDTRGALRDDGAPYAEEAAKARAIREGREASEAEVDAINLVPDAYRGLDRFEARARIVADITAEGLAVMVPESDPRLGRKSASSDAPPGGQAGDPEDSFEEGGTPIELALVPLVEPKTIQQPHGDRSGTVIEPMLTDQWFVDTARIVQPAIDAVRNGDVAIVPESDRKVYFHWLENIEPWCISRQLWWGHQVPVWYGPGVTTWNTEDGGYATRVNHAEPIAFCAPTFQEATRKALAHYQANSRDLSIYQTDAADVTDAANKFVDSDDMVLSLWRDPDVLDTWFSSGLWPLGTLGWPADTPELDRYYPTSLLVTGQDILFFWVARMMMMQLAVLPDSLPIMERIPFKAVYLHGLVRDAKGKKMSKSLGNVVDPLDVIDEYGADALRFTNAAMASLGGALKLDVSRIAGYRNFGTKLWNAVRFAEMYDVQFVKSGSPDLPQNVKNTVNRWILGETASVREAVDAALAAYRFDDAANALYRFVWNVVCDWYVEFSKPVLQGEATDDKRETQAVMGWVLERSMAMLHPFMPFVTEELWRVTGHDGMLVTSRWPQDDGAQAIDAEAQSEIRWVVAFVEAVRSARAQMNVPAGAVIPVVAVEWDDAARKSFANNEKTISTLARIDGLTDGAAPKGSIAATVQGARFALPLEGVIDVATERARLDKSVAKLDKEINGMKRRVDNHDFAASAPPEVVEETRANLAARTSERDAVHAALASLEELT